MRSVAAWEPPRWRTLGAGAVLAAVAALAGIALTGAATPTILADPGAVVRWGLPVVELVVDLACAVTIGALVLAAVVLPRAGDAQPSARRRTRVTPDGGAWVLAQRTAAVASVVWTLAVAVQLVLTYASVSGRPIGGPTFGDELGVYLTQIGLGQAGLWALALTALTSLLAVAATGYASAAWAAVLALAALAPVAQTGHAAGATNHTLAVGSLWLHLAGVTVWIGGLAVLVVVAGALGRDLRPVAARYSHLAIWAYALVAVSGVVNAYVRIGSLAGLATPYGAILLLKVACAVLLGVAGWWHRRRTIPRLTSGRTAPFWRLVAAEVVLAGAVMGLAVALSSTSPPVPDTPPTAPSPAEAITGYPPPAEPTVAGWFTLVQPDVLVLTGVVSAAVVIVGWTLRLRRRGDAWPAGRGASMLVGLLLVAWASSGGAAVYGHVLFSGHMVQHMVLVMLAPIFLVLGAPVTLGLRALPSRDDGSRGPRELLLAVVHSKVAAFFGHPIVAAVNVAGSMILFYYSPLFELSLTNHLVHLWMIVHFTLAGYLFVNVLIGIDPGPRRPSYPLRLLLLFATMAFHAFFGLALTEGTQLLAARWFGALGLPWGVDALADQRLGGAFAWGFGEIPSLVLAIALGLAWIRDDERTARRLDRAADRSGDADLAAYNAMLARMAGTSHTERPSSPTEVDL
ncbi:cytochrome c oxidase assembly protein [Miniimonas sp. S16]|uniref:cytochrome c oxidase assembly protein n=1 Tax=Miniimonas sp. S16 TaxID=2171623 RepID=UPI000D528BCA|nr:cytochrome c oxidase assembly protein [Miniimonas sp. S16]